MRVVWQNPQWRADVDGIDVDVEHPEYGWLPYLALPDDPLDIHFQGDEVLPERLYATIVASGVPIADANPIPPPPTPDIAPKLALVRAMRLRQMNGNAITNPATQTSVWQYVQAALAQADPTVQEDWDLLTSVPRQDPIMRGLVQGLPFPAGVDPDAMVDQIFQLAAAIDRGEVDPYTGEIIG